MFKFLFDKKFEFKSPHTKEEIIAILKERIEPSHLAPFSIQDKTMKSYEGIFASNEVCFRAKNHDDTDSSSSSPAGRISIPPRSTKIKIVSQSTGSIVHGTLRVNRFLSGFAIFVILFLILGAVVGTIERMDRVDYFVPLMIVVPMLVVVYIFFKLPFADEDDIRLIFLHQLLNSSTSIKTRKRPLPAEYYGTSHGKLKWLVLLTAIVGLYSQLVVQFNINFFWESKSVFVIMLLICCVIGLINLIHIANRNNYTSRFPRAFLIITIMVIIWQSITIGTMHSSQPNLIAKNYLRTNSALKKEVGKILSVQNDLKYGYSNDSDSKGSYENWRIGLLVKGEKKFINITVHVRKYFDTNTWAIQGTKPSY